MKYRFRLLNIIGLVTFLFFGISSFSQELDLNGYLILVKKNNYGLKLGENQKKLATQDAKIAKSLLLPSISIDGHYQRDFNKNFLFINDFDGTISQFRTNFNNTIDLNAMVNQTVFDPTVFSTVRIARLAAELSKLNQESISNTLVAQASSLYWQAVFVKESVDVLEANSKLAKEQIEQVERVYGLGGVSELQVQQARSQYQKTLPALNNAKNQFENLLNELKLLANIPVTQDLVLSDNLETIQIHPLIMERDSKLEQQPEIRAIKKEVEIAERQIVGKKNFWYPKLNLVAGYNYNGQDDNFKFGNSANKLLFSQLRISIPIFSGGSNRAEIAKAKIEKEAAELNLLNKKQEFLKQLQVAENDYNNAIENIKLYRETIQTSEREIAIFKKQLSLGVVTPIEFKESRLRLTQSKLDLLNGHLDLHIAQLQITRILGENN